MLLKLYEKNNNPADLQQVIDLLNDGGILIYPTDTMYAIVDTHWRRGNIQSGGW